MSNKATRARSLSVEDRQEMLIDVVTPLLIEHGQALTTKQIATGAGIAEGTIFRAFGTKDELIQAAVDRQLDPEPFRDRLRGIDVTLPLEDKVRAIVVLMRDRFTTVFTIMTALGRFGPPHAHDPRHDFTDVLGQAVEADLDRLNFGAERAGQIIRMVALSTSIQQIRGGLTFSADEVTDVILYGIMGRRADGSMGAHHKDLAPVPVDAPASPLAAIPDLALK
ncbi:TetR/AcrR family transcriptional regulator [Cryobacterium psychrophilum]|uniref:TetR/AcrR family transcriptional regulator n=1 Tax=Cryobacterium psychrophilum TaxID=41988 RepID=A0A4Y8KPH7_9MICO|nr:TetR/AcrR family transcriptional regulator [Cryobacterium psychrophilum]TDW29157.1 TetR family transcriptional regulator [Cryobacterium psychrophilum]TFD77818.1 TetR/AcrR family transcriptional regulator [Cryobacterium psychrophilum]